MSVQFAAARLEEVVIEENNKILGFEVIASDQEMANVIQDRLTNIIGPAVSEEKSRELNSQRRAFGTPKYKPESGWQPSGSAWKPKNPQIN